MLVHAKEHGDKFVIVNRDTGKVVDDLIMWANDETGTYARIRLDDNGEIIFNNYGEPSVELVYNSNIEIVEKS